MARYVDGFLLPVPKKNVRSYRNMAQKAGMIWRQHGAVEYMECAGDDLKIRMGMPFPKLVKPKSSETIFYSFIVYKSRAHRDAVNAKVMKDKRIQAMMKSTKMPFDVKRMSYGGFKALVDL